MNNLSKISLAITLGLSTLLVATSSFADEKSRCQPRWKS